MDMKVEMMIWEIPGNPVFRTQGLRNLDLASSHHLLLLAASCHLLLCVSEIIINYTAKKSFVYSLNMKTKT